MNDVSKQLGPPPSFYFDLFFCAKPFWCLDVFVSADIRRAWKTNSGLSVLLVVFSNLLHIFCLGSILWCLTLFIHKFYSVLTECIICVNRSPSPQESCFWKSFENSSRKTWWPLRYVILITTILSFGFFDENSFTVTGLVTDDVWALYNLNDNTDSISKLVHNWHRFPRKIALTNHPEVSIWNVYCSVAAFERMCRPGDHVLLS